MRKKKFDTWCMENEKIVNEIYSLITPFMENLNTDNCRLRSVQINYDKLFLVIQLYLYRTANNAYRTTY
jgi:hypothetical protein